MNIVWFVIRSSHALVEGAAKSPCGRLVRGEVTDTMPAGRSCESCLRWVARRADKG